MDLESPDDLGSDNRAVIRSEDRHSVPVGSTFAQDLDAHRKRLIEGFEFSRWFILTYQAAVIGIVVLVGFWGWHEARTRAQRHRRGTAGRHESKSRREAMVIQDTERCGSSSSRTSPEEYATIPLCVAPHLKAYDEASPLLGTGDGQRASLPHIRNSFRRVLCWIWWALMYQPPALPILNKALPDNATTLYILVVLTLNLFYLIFNIQPSPSAIDILADRAGLLFVANLPWLYLLSAKNCPLKLLTGHSYENLNLLHRRLGEWMCFLAAVHLGGMIVGWYDFLRPIHFSLYRFITLPYILWGCGAWICYELLYVTSLRSFRERWYEMFLGSHIFLQIGALATLFMHHFRARVYVAATLGIFLLDRLVWRLRIKTWTIHANLEVMKDGQTVRVSANWPILSYANGFWRRRLGSGMQYGWLPSQHVYITIPAMGRAYALQAHPMTIASAAPAPEQNQTHAWFSLIIRAKSGFSRDLLHYANVHRSTNIRLDGPYGSMHALNTLYASDNAVIVAGGSGIAVAYPMLWDLLHYRQRTEQTICLIWIIQDESYEDWIGRERLQELEELGLDLVIPPPSRNAGRPDIEVLVRQKVEEVEGRTGIVVSGPDGLNRNVRNCCAELVRCGKDIDVVVEKFGW